jgi:hypothetical protein
MFTEKTFISMLSKRIQNFWLYEHVYGTNNHGKNLQLPHAEAAKHCAAKGMILPRMDDYSEVVIFRNMLINEGLGTGLLGAKFSDKSIFSGYMFGQGCKLQTIQASENLNCMELQLNTSLIIVDCTQPRSFFCREK